MIYLILSAAAAIFIFGFFVGRNNPSLKAVDKLIATGKIVKDSAGRIVTVIKS
jgi:hypothetical protein